MNKHKCWVKTSILKITKVSLLLLILSLSTAFPLDDNSDISTKNDQPVHTLSQDSLATQSLPSTPRQFPEVHVTGEVRTVSLQITEDGVPIMRSIVNPMVFTKELHSETFFEPTEVETPLSTPTSPSLVNTTSSVLVNNTSPTTIEKSIPKTPINLAKDKTSDGSSENIQIYHSKKGSLESVHLIKVVPTYVSKKPKRLSISKDSNLTSDDVSIAIASEKTSPKLRDKYENFKDIGEKETPSFYPSTDKYQIVNKRQDSKKIIKHESQKELLLNVNKHASEGVTIQNTDKIPNNDGISNGEDNIDSMNINDFLNKTLSDDLSNSSNSFTEESKIEVKTSHFEEENSSDSGAIDKKIIVKTRQTDVSFFEESLASTLQSKNFDKDHSRRFSHDKISKEGISERTILQPSLKAKQENNRRPKLPDINIRKNDALVLDNSESSEQDIEISKQVSHNKYDGKTFDETEMDAELVSNSNTKPLNESRISPYPDLKKNVIPPQKRPPHEDSRLIKGVLNSRSLEPYVTDIDPNPSTSTSEKQMSPPITEPIDKLAPGCIAAIVLGVLLLLLAAIGSLAFVVYNRHSGIRPKMLSDRSSSNSDSGGYFDDQCRVAYVNSQMDVSKGTPEDLVSLDNDSFLNSLESMTIQNLWTDNVRHTKL